MFARQEPGRGGLGGYNRGFQGGRNHPFGDPGLPFLIAHVTNLCVNGKKKATGVVVQTTGRAVGSGAIINQ